MMGFWLMSSGRRSVTIVIAASVYNPNIEALAVAAGWSGNGALDLIINPGVDVARLEIASSIPHDVLKITSYGRIGGVRGEYPAQVGGTGLFTRSRLQMQNHGTMFGGGGRGGDGESASVCWGSDCHTASGGSGAPGAGFYSPSGTWNTFEFQATGSPGNAGWNSTRPPTGYPGDSGSWISPGYGGRGGDLGQPGQAGGSADWGGSYNTAGGFSRGNGARAGYCVDGNAYVSWLVEGTRIGPLV